MLKVEDEVAFGLENLMYKREKIKEKIKSSLKKVDLYPYRNWMLNRLSGGMKQRVAIASLLAMDQEILIFDETTSNLDPAGTREVSEIIKSLPGNKTLLIIEHKLDEFIDIFDKILLLNKKGEVIAFDSTREIFLNYQPQLQNMEVWIPQIVKYVHKLYKNNIKLDNFPLGKDRVKDALSNINNIEDKKKAFYILKNELKKYIVKIPNEKRKLNSAKNCIIKVENLSYKFKQSKDLVLEDINFSVNKGDFMGIVGHNGSGKTTLAKLIVNLYKAELPSKISIYNPTASDDNRIARKDEILEFTGFVFQNPEHQFVEDTVYKEVTYGLKIKHKDKHYIDRKSEQILKLMNLERFRDKNPFNLSQGQKRKLSVAYILVMDHQILILDEPTFGLDYITTTNLMELLASLNKKGKTVIIITHDMNIIFKYTRKVLVLKEGNLVFFGSTYKLLDEKEIMQSSKLSVPSLYELYKEVITYAVL